MTAAARTPVDALAHALEREGVEVDLGTRYLFSPGDARRAAYRDKATRILKTLAEHGWTLAPSPPPGTLDDVERSLAEE
jgi:hypothetical protein